MLGNKSIYKTFKVKNKVIKVQANRNYGICDIFLPIEKEAPTKPEISSKEADRLYKELKFEYDCYMQSIKAQRQSFLNKFQGRQLNSENIQYKVYNFLTELFNEKK